VHRADPNKRGDKAGESEQADGKDLDLLLLPNVILRPLLCACVGAKRWSQISQPADEPQESHGRKADGDRSKKESLGYAVKIEGYQRKAAKEQELSRDRSRGKPTRPHLLSRRSECFASDRTLRIFRPDKSRSE
jgi:hypothetical protein